MAMAYVVVQYKHANGKVKEATHGMESIPASGTPAFVENDWIAIGGPLAGGAAFATNSDPVNPAANPGTYLEALVGFHRALHGAHVNIVGIRCHDGSTPGVSQGAHASVELNLQCRGYGMITATSSQSTTTVAPGNAGMLVEKNPLEFSADPGRLWLRFAFEKSHVYDAGDDAIACLAADVPLYRTRLENATNASEWVGGIGDGLAAYFGAAGKTLPVAVGTITAVRYVIINTVEEAYVNENGQPKTRRVMSGTTQVSGMSFSDIQSRQNSRQGRRAS